MIHFSHTREAFITTNASFFPSPPSLQLAQAKLAVYTGALSSIKEATGVDDLETLVQTFDR